MWFDILIQAIGFIAIGVNLIAVQFNKYSTIILFKTIGSLLFVLQYIFLGAYTGMIMDIIGSIRNIIFSSNVKNNRSNRNAVIVFSLLTAILGITTIVLTWDVSEIRWTDNVKFATILMVFIGILSIIAKLLSTVAYSIKSPHTIRMLNIPSCSCWLIYNLVVFSIAGFVNEVMTICSIIIAEIRFKKPNSVIEKEPKKLSFAKCIWTKIKSIKWNKTVNPVISYSLFAGAITLSLLIGVLVICL